jgi:tRNA(Ile)-lysidine synthase
MHALLRQVVATARARRLFPEPGLAVVAVSGGPDSVALLHALAELAGHLELELLVAHLDHGLRGDEATQDAAAVGEMAGKLGLPVEIGVRRVAPARGMSLEEVARNVRYAFLGHVAARHRARYLAIAHSADDQAETLLMRLLRGAGPRGLQAMTPIRAGGQIEAGGQAQAGARARLEVVRPFLDTPRGLIRAYLADRQLPFRLDRTNRDLRLLRNRVRNVLMPLLASEFNPSLVVALGRTAELMAEVDEHLSAEAEAALDSGVLVQASGEGPAAGAPPGPPAHLALDLKRLSTYDLILRRYLIRQAIRRLRSDLRGIGFDHIDALLGLAGASRRGRRVELPQGMVGLREGDCLTLWSADPGEAAAIPFTPVPFDAAGEHRVELLEVGLAVRTRLVKVAELPADPMVNRTGGRAGEDPGRAVFDRALLRLPLAVRSRRAGDRIRPLGRAAAKKVKDLLIDARVPRRLRAAVPLLVDGAGEPEERILWIAGHRRSAHAQVSQGTTEILEVELSDSTSSKKARSSPCPVSGRSRCSCRPSGSPSASASWEPRSRATTPAGTRSSSAS